MVKSLLMMLSLMEWGGEVTFEYWRSRRANRRGPVRAGSGRPATPVRRNPQVPGRGRAGTIPATRDPRPDDQSAPRRCAICGCGHGERNVALVRQLAATHGRL